MLTERKQIDDKIQYSLSTWVFLAASFNSSKFLLSVYKHRPAVEKENRVSSLQFLIAYYTYWSRKGRRRRICASVCSSSPLSIRSLRHLACRTEPAVHGSHIVDAIRVSSFYPLGQYFPHSHSFHSSHHGIICFLWESGSPSRSSEQAHNYSVKFVACMMWWANVNQAGRLRRCVRILLLWGTTSDGTKVFRQLERSHFRYMHCTDTTRKLPHLIISIIGHSTRPVRWRRLSQVKIIFRWLCCHIRVHCCSSYPLYPCSNVFSKGLDDRNRENCRSSKKKFQRLARCFFERKKRLGKIRLTSKKVRKSNGDMSQR